VNLLSEGNSKLGPAIFTWSIPGGETCPGASPACAAECYAKKGRMFSPHVRAHYTRNLTITQRDTFARLMIAEVKRRWPRVVRIHAAGDFYSAEYVRKWIEVARACPDVRFYAYTRSWRVAEIAGALVELAKLPNVRLWYSADHDTGLPPKLPRRVRVAWMQTEGDDLPRKADVLFRVQRLRKTVQKRVALPLAVALTCPVENGATGHLTDCQRCGVCWRS
jgi:hypothetical protein